VHAYLEEKIFYPQLLQRGADDPEGETLDAIGDHNDIRDAEEGLSDFRRHAPIGLREALGVQYSEFMAEHPTTKGLRIADRDPQSTSTTSKPALHGGRRTARSVLAASKVNDASESHEVVQASVV
jgi:hypothetical protein